VFGHAILAALMLRRKQDPGGISYLKSGLSRNAIEGWVPAAGLLGH